MLYDTSVVLTAVCLIPDADYGSDSAAATAAAKAAAQADLDAVLPDTLDGAQYAIDVVQVERLGEPNTTRWRAAVSARLVFDAEHDVDHAEATRTGLVDRACHEALSAAPKIGDHWTPWLVRTADIDTQHAWDLQQYPIHAFDTAKD